MPKRSSKPKAKRRKPTHEDVNQLAYRLVQESTAEPQESFSKAQISQVMAALGRRGGKIGGKRRLETMTAEERSQVALKAAKARWANRNKPL